jgi:hypothetical protein
VFDDERPEDDADGGADPEDGGHEPDAACNLLSWKLVADDPEGEREDAAADALDHPGDDEEGERVRDGGEQRARTEHDEGPDEHVLLPEHVPEAPDDRRSDRRGQQVAGKEPGDARLSGIEVVLDRGQGRHDGGAEHRVGEPGD